LRIFSFGGYGLALAALALVVFGAHDSYPLFSFFFGDFKKNIFMLSIFQALFSAFETQIDKTNRSG